LRFPLKCRTREAGDIVNKNWERKGKHDGMRSTLVPSERVKGQNATR